MKVTYNSKGGRLAVELTGETHKDIFKQISSFQEVFEQTNCGACHKDNLRFVVRSVTKDKKTYDYYELHCQDCRARLAFGQHMEGGSLFPSRKDEEGKWLANSGWVTWNPAIKQEA